MRAHPERHLGVGGARTVRRRLRLWTSATVAVLAMSSAGCSAGDPDHAGAAHPTVDSSSPGSPSRSPVVDEAVPAAHPAVRYAPTTASRTRRTVDGYLVNTCVPHRLDELVTTLTASDGKHLSALALGSGDRGVLLTHEMGYYICSWLPLAEELAADGYRVVLVELRGHNASEASDPADHIERDVAAGLHELHRLGAHQVLLGGASCGGTASAVNAATEPHLVGLLILSSPGTCGHIDAVGAVRRITAPSFFAASPGDLQGGILREVRRLYDASAASDKHLELMPGEYHGTDMLNNPDQERTATLHSLVRRFIDRAFSSP